MSLGQLTHRLPTQARPHDVIGFSRIVRSRSAWPWYARLPLLETRKQPSAHHGQRIFSIRPQDRRWLSQTSPESPNAQSKGGSPGGSRRLLVKLFLAGLGAAAVSYTIWTQYTEPSRKPLSAEKFTPFTITAREQVSSTAVVLTVRPANDKTAEADARAIAAAHAHGLWSVEIRQPQLQVAREYTPLPPRRRAGEDDDAAAGAGAELRFLIRRYDAGEVSRYLCALPVGAQVDVRGPRLGFDLRTRLGTARRVVFLAGGTGIAPALQAAGAVLGWEGGESTVSIVWANRRGEDCVGCPRLLKSGLSWVLGRRRESAGEGGEGQGAIMAQLAELKARYPGRLELLCTVDDEGTFIDEDLVARATGALRGGKLAEAVSSTTCQYHSQKALALQPARNLPGEKCQCDITDELGGGGKNLLLVSGPDGFIEKYTGAMLWSGGRQIQGPVSGLIGGLSKKHPELRKEWLVLKL